MNIDPTPLNKIIEIGIQAMGGIGLSNSIIVSEKIFNFLYHPIKIPNGIAKLDAIIAPIKTLNKLAPECSIRVAFITGSLKNSKVKKDLIVSIGPGILNLVRRDHITNIKKIENRRMIIFFIFLPQLLNWKS